MLDFYQNISLKCIVSRGGKCFAAFCVFYQGVWLPLSVPVSFQCHPAENYDKMLEHKSETLSIDSIGGGCFSNTGGLAGEEKEMNSLVELWDKIYSKYGRWVSADKTTHKN